MTMDKVAGTEHHHEGLRPAVHSVLHGLFIDPLSENDIRHEHPGADCVKALPSPGQQETIEAWQR